MKPRKPAIPFVFVTLFLDILGIGLIIPILPRLVVSLQGGNVAAASHTVGALAALYSARSVEIEVAHADRAAGESKYSLYKLILLNFDLMTGFSLVPLQIFSFAGVLLAAASGILFVYLLLRRLFLGPEAEGVFTLFALVFFFLGIALFGIGLLGEYIGRIYLQVRERPRYIIAATLEAPPDRPDGSAS